MDVISVSRELKAVLATAPGSLRALLCARHCLRSLQAFGEAFSPDQAPNDLPRRNRSALALFRVSFASAATVEEGFQQTDGLAALVSASRFLSGPTLPAAGGFDRILLASAVGATLRALEPYETSERTEPSERRQASVLATLVRQARTDTRMTTSLAALARCPVWPQAARPFDHQWKQMRLGLGGRHDRWDVWIDWADGVLADPTSLLAPNPARLFLPEEAWQLPAGELNQQIALIERLAAGCETDDATYPEAVPTPLRRFAEPDAEQPGVGTANDPDDGGAAR